MAAGTTRLILALGCALAFFSLPQSLSAASVRQVVFTPASGPCGTAVVARATGFAPGVQYRYGFMHDRTRALIGYNTMGSDDHIQPDGTITLRLRISDCDEHEPIGSTYTLRIWEWFPNTTDVNGIGASGVFTVSGGGVVPTSLPNTGGGAAAMSMKHTLPGLSGSALP